MHGNYSFIAQVKETGLTIFALIFISFGIVLAICLRVLSKVAEELCGLVEIFYAKN